jgi:isopentenyl-diphosphate delta-isomerase
MSHLVPLVNEHDEVIGFKQRNEITARDINRATGLWITNSKGEILLARRSSNKQHNPNRWGSAVAGTVEYKETYEASILKEAEEELGLTNIVPIPVKKILMSGSNPHFTQWYSCVVDKSLNEFTIQVEEVAEIRWFTETELKDLLQKKPDAFVNNVFDWINLFLEI